MEQKVEWMDTPETTTTGAPAVLEIQKKKTTKTFPEEVVIEAKFQVLVSCLDGGGQHKWWIRGKTANWSKTYGQQKNIAPKEYCLQIKVQHIVNIRKVF